MKQTNLGTQFVNSFVRQLGREAAHDAYRSSNSNSNIFTRAIGVSGSKIYNPTDSQAFNLLVWFPFVTIYYFIKGIVMALSRKPKFQKLVDVLYYKPDRRCTCGARCLGRGTELGEKFTTTEWSDEERKTYNQNGYNLIFISLIIEAIKLGVLYFVIKTGM